MLRPPSSRRTRRPHKSGSAGCGNEKRLPAAPRSIITRFRAPRSIADSAAVTSAQVRGRCDRWPIPTVQPIEFSGSVSQVRRRDAAISLDEGQGRRQVGGFEEVRLHSITTASTNDRNIGLSCGLHNVARSQTLVSRSRWRQQLSEGIEFADAPTRPATVSRVLDSARYTRF
jgi:hypothetical protein